MGMPHCEITQSGFSISSDLSYRGIGERNCDIDSVSEKLVFRLASRQIELPKRIQIW